MAGRPNDSSPVLKQKLICSIPLLRGLASCCDCCRFSCTGNGDSPIFVLVHGTWANRSKWFQDRELLSSAIMERWHTAKIYRFKWSGANGLSARFEAAKFLSQQLKTLKADNLTSPIVAISHSHGGNLVAWASTQIDSPIEAAVYVNTPFIQLEKPADRGDVFFGCFLTAMILVCVDGLLSVQIWSFVNSHAFFRPNIVDIVKLTPSILLVLATIIFVFKLPRWGRKNVELLKQLSTSPRKAIRGLVVFSVRDEPAAALNTVFFYRWISSSLFLLLMMGFAYWGLFKHGIHLNKVKFPDQAAYPLALGFLLYVILSSVGFGVAQTLLSFMQPIVISPGPLDQSTLKVCPSDSGFRHGHPLRSPSVVKEILDWVQKVAVPTQKVL
jgi:pimeloyl-ACP methyl ester carboxylesterase